MDKRKELILDTIIKEHIETGAPVGSGVLCEKYKLEVSPATVRNDMAYLEEEGYIAQPHTSAGRVPTEKAYLYYLEKIKNEKISKIDAAALEELFADASEESFKGLAKKLSEMTGNAVFWAFHRHNVFYTGISNLFQQPEFSQLDMIYDISSVIDRIDEIVDELFDKIDSGLETRLGQDNPFGEMCGTIMIKYRSGEHTGMFGVLGPIRMNYERNIGLVEFINKKLHKTSTRL